MNYKVRKLYIQPSDQLRELQIAAGELYSKTLVYFWRVVRKKGVWLGQNSMEKIFPNDSQGRLHAHSADAAVQLFFQNLKGWNKRRKTNPETNPPHKTRFFQTVIWKSIAIRIKDKKIILSNGKGNAPIIIDWKWELPKMVQLKWVRGKYQLSAVYMDETKSSPIGDGVAGIDLGEIHPMVIHAGDECLIYNGRFLRSKRQYRNKVKAKLNSKIDTKKKGGKRRRKTIISKKKQLHKLDNQIRDIEHKLTTHLVSTAYSKGVQTLVIGDLRNFRVGLDKGKKINQKLHQWSFGRITKMITYKAKRLGMEIVLINEAYTSQECPCCGKMNKPKKRNYRCSCGFKCHRDELGSFNIRKKYLRESGVNQLIGVVGAMASPIGVKFYPNMEVHQNVDVCRKAA